MTVKLLTKHHLVFLSLTGVCTDQFEHTLVQMPHRWKSHVTAHMVIFVYFQHAVQPALGIC